MLYSADCIGSLGYTLYVLGGVSSGSYIPSGFGSGKCTLSTTKCLCCTGGKKTNNVSNRCVTLDNIGRRPAYLNGLSQWLDWRRYQGCCGKRNLSCRTPTKPVCVELKITHPPQLPKVRIIGVSYVGVFVFELRVVWVNSRRCKYFSLLGEHLSY